MAEQSPRLWHGIRGCCTARPKRGGAGGWSAKAVVFTGPTSTRISASKISLMASHRARASNRFELGSIVGRLSRRPRPLRRMGRPPTPATKTEEVRRCSRGPRPLDLAAIAIAGVLAKRQNSPFTFLLTARCPRCPKRRPQTRMTPLTCPKRRPQTRMSPLSPMARKRIVR